MKASERDYDVAGKIVARWRTWWGQLVDAWPNDVPVPATPGVPSRLEFASDIAEALAAARLAGVRAGIEAAIKDAEFQRDELPGLLHGTVAMYAFDVCIQQRIEDAKAYIERFKKLDAAKIAQEGAA